MTEADHDRPAHAPNRRPIEGAANLVQACIFAGAAVYLSGAWLPAAIVSGVCAALQLAAGLAAITGRPPETAGRLSGATLVGVAILAGLFLHAALHLIARFGADAGRSGLQGVAGVVLALPWIAGLPLWQVLRGRRQLRGVSAAVVAAVVGPGILGLSAGQPALLSPPDPTPLAADAFASWSEGRTLAAATSGGAGPILLTPWCAGAPGETVAGNGDTLAAAIADGVQRLSPPCVTRPSLVLDLPAAHFDDDLVPIGTGGSLTKDGGVSPTAAWRPGKVSHRTVLPRWRVPVIDLRGGVPTAFRSAVASASGAAPIGAGWVVPEATTADAVRDAAVAGARMLAANQRADGRYAYVIKGPSGATGSGYSLPRHGGVAWYLARAAERTGDPTLKNAADRGLVYLAAQTTTLPDGSAYVATSQRTDGKAWVGTTALAALAGVVQDHPMTESWGRFLAASVDEDGRVRGEAQRATGAFPDQAQNPYGQGQTVLALAALVRAGHEEFRDPMERSARYFVGGYGPLGANRLIPLDEHWACLADLAVRDVDSTLSLESICAPYLHIQQATTPAPDRGYRPSSGPAGGAAEAVVAAAWLGYPGNWTADAARYADWFLESAYRAGDSPFLQKPRVLVGGFRDRAFDLDVRMDSVQHIGCALLGIEALMRGERLPGSMP